MHIPQTIENWYFYDAIDKINDVLAIIVFLVLITACFSALSYMNSIPTVKKCLLLYFYKDTISSILWLRAIRMIEAILGNLNIGRTNKVQALTLSFAIACGFLYMTLILTLINIYKLYMAKTKTVDPKIPFLDEDEELAIRKIRIICLLITIGSISTTFAMGWYPSVFYAMMPNQEPRNNLLISNIIYRGIMIVLLLINCVISLVRKYYQGTTEISIDKVIPKAIKYIVIQSFLILTITAVAEALQIAEFKDIRIIQQLIHSLTLIVVPILLISRSDQLKSHSIRFLKNKYDNAFLLSIYLVPVCLFILINVCIFFSI